MPDTSSCTCSDVHARAICDEVGERLRFLLDRSQTPPPQKILTLLLRLQLSELKAPKREPERRSPASTAA
jgi:hypothetical protein